MANKVVPQVIAVGYDRVDLVGADAPVARFGSPLSRGDLPRLAEISSDALERGSFALAIYPDRYEEPTLRRLLSVRSALNAPRLIPYASSLPPLSGGVLCGLAAAAARHLGSPGVLPAALPRLERELIVFAWLSGVSGLEQPAPSVWQHMVSMAPWTRFGVRLQPDPFVKVLRKKDDDLKLPSLERASVAVIGDSGGDADWVKRTTEARFGRIPVREAEGAELAARWWGTKRSVEAVVFPLDIAAVAAAIVRTLRVRECDWCGQRIVALKCPLCGSDTSERSVAEVGA